MHNDITDIAMKSCGKGIVLSNAAKMIESSFRAVNFWYKPNQQFLASL
jgi:hypothetical protein